MAAPVDSLVLDCPSLDSPRVLAFRAEERLGEPYEVHVFVDLGGGHRGHARGDAREGRDPPRGAARAPRRPAGVPRHRLRVGAHPRRGPAPRAAPPRRSATADPLSRPPQPGVRRHGDPRHRPGDPLGEPAHVVRAAAERDVRGARPRLPVSRERFSRSCIAGSSERASTITFSRTGPRKSSSSPTTRIVTTPRGASPCATSPAAGGVRASASRRGTAPIAR